MITEYLFDGPITQDIISDIIIQIGHRTDSGGHSIFLGQVRADEINGKWVKAIEYSAYEGMVKIEADSIKGLIFAEFEDAKAIEIIHSRGVVKTGEISLFVIVSAGHRHQAMQACAKTVELIKEKLPVWKKEIYSDESYEWKQNR